MSDARWTEVDKDIDNALMHFDLAVQIFQTGEFDSSDILESYKSSSGLMHGMDAGYTSIENAIQRILRILGETPPSEGKSWHKDLIDRVTTPMKGSNARPAFFDRDLRDDLLECMKIRHLVRHGDYGEFDPGKAGPSVDAARRIVARFRLSPSSRQRSIPTLMQKTMAAMVLAAAHPADLRSDHVASQ